jgi:CheY-like chemotaxis protein
MTPNAILLSDDLIFTSRVTGTARDLGLHVIPARTATALLALAQKQAPTCVIVDLSNPGLVIDELAAGLSILPARPRIVAYGSHVDTATLRSARDAGCDVVLPRSQFVADLAAALPSWLLAPSGESDA